MLKKVIQESENFLHNPDHIKITYDNTHELSPLRVYNLVRGYFRLNNANHSDVGFIVFKYYGGYQTKCFLELLNNDDSNQCGWNRMILVNKQNKPISITYKQNGCTNELYSGSSNAYMQFGVLGVKKYINYKPNPKSKSTKYSVDNPIQQYNEWFNQFLLR